MADFERTTKILEEYSKAVLDEYIRILQANKKPASGELINSASFTVTANGTQFICYLNLAEHWKYVENGRKAGGKFPPLEKIKEWIQIKPVKPYKLKNGKIPTLDQLSYLIGRSIAKLGIKPLPAVEVAKTKMLPKYIEKIKVALRQDLTSDL